MSGGDQANNVAGADEEAGGRDAPAGDGGQAGHILKDDDLQEQPRADGGRDQNQGPAVGCLEAGINGRRPLPEQGQGDEDQDQDHEDRPGSVLPGEIQRAGGAVNGRVGGDAQQEGQAKFVQPLGAC